jgi:predicted DNA-binding transcriptional regulator AlpA
MTVQFDDPLLTPQETAERLRVAIGSLAVWRCLDAKKKGKAKRRGPTWTKIGALVRYRKSDVEAFIANRVAE